MLKFYSHDTLEPTSIQPNVFILMSRVCQMTGRGTQTGNSRSHSNIATRRKFKVNVQTKRLGGMKLRLSTRAIRTLTKASK